MATREVLNVHIEYTENAEHFVYRETVPRWFAKKLCLLVARGMLFGGSWELGSGDNWSIWRNGKCIEANGDHVAFAEMAENDVPWIYGEAV